MIFTRAGPAEILRSSQKDEFYSQKIQQMIADLVLQLSGPGLSLKYKWLIDAAGLLCYFGFTTLNGLQTLGEEYTGILLVDESLKSLPSRLNRLGMILCQCFGASVTLHLVKKWEKSLKNNSSLTPVAKSHLLKVCSALISVLPIIDRLHKALFFLNWGTYHLSKRLFSNNYVLMRYWLKDRQSLYGFKILGVISLVHLAIFIVTGTLSWLLRVKPSLTSSTGSVKEVSLSRNIQCILCLEPITNPSCTPCGHVFCWKCIIDSLTATRQCPLCRQPVLPSRVIPLHNY